MSDWQPIETAPLGVQLIVWEKDYGWLLSVQERPGEWGVKGSGNHYSRMPQSVIEGLACWMYPPAPPSNP